MRLDASSAPGLSVSIEPAGTSCAGVCDVLVPVGVEGAVVAASASGEVPAFEGDCDQVLGGRCLFTSDRVRSISVHSGSVRVRVEVHGPGVVTVPAARIRCEADSTCGGFAVRGALVEAQALPPSPLTDLVTWGNLGCTTLTCAQVANADVGFVVTVVPRARLQLELIGSGEGYAELNGTTVTFPYSSLVELGTRVTMVAHPSVDDVVAGFDGLPCELPRTIETCSFVMDSSKAGAVRLHRFFQWALGGWPGSAGGSVQFADLISRPPGVLVALNYYNYGGGPAWLPVNATGMGTAVVAIGLDGGLGRLSAAEGFGLAGPRFLELPDGGLWLAGGFFRSPIGTSPRAHIEWGDVDASIPDRNGEDVALLEFDESRFTARRMVSPPASRPDVSRVWVGSGRVVAAGERLLLNFRERGGLLDGGLPAPETNGIGAWTGDFQLQSVEPVATAEQMTFSTTANDEAVMLFRGNPSWPAASCRAPQLWFAFLSRISGAGQCASVVTATDERLRYMGRLFRVGANLLFQGVTTAPHGGAGESRIPHLLAFDDSLTRRWDVTLAPVEPGGPTWRYDMLPGTVASLGSGLVAVWEYRGTDVTAFRAENGLTITCELTGAVDPAAQLLITRHSAATGAVEWGVCLPAMQNGIARFSLGPEEVIGAYGGIMLAATANPHPGAGSFIELGSHQIPVPGASMDYLLLVTPPSE